MCGCSRTAPGQAESLVGETALSVSTQILLRFLSGGLIKKNDTTQTVLETATRDNYCSHDMRDMKMSSKNKSCWITDERPSLSENSSPEGNIPMYSSTESWLMARDFITSGSPTLTRSRRTKPYLVDDIWDLGDVRPRVSSMPVRGSIRRPKRTMACDSLGQVSRVKSYMITPKGLINQGDCFLKRSTTLGSNPDMSCTRDGEPMDRHPDCSVYRVVILGSSGVGKHSLIHAFVKDRDNDKGSSMDEESDKSVSILVNGEHSTMQFVDFSDREVDDDIKNESADGFVVVYSVEDRRSYEASINRLLEVREEIGHHVALILVANKTDLVRSRVVTEEDGRTAANTYDSKYIEVSAAIDYKIDDLLVGVLKQIQLFKQKYNRFQDRQNSTALNSCCAVVLRDNALTKVFRRQASKSCDDLYVL